MDFKKLLTLKPHQKITLVHFAADGLPKSCQCYVRHTNINKDNIVTLQFKPLNSTARSIQLGKSTQFILWDGWVQPNVDIAVKHIMKESALGGMQMMAQRLRKEDGRYIQKAIDSVEKSPIIYYVSPLVEEKFYDMHFVIQPQPEVKNGNIK